MGAVKSDSEESAQKALNQKVLEDNMDKYDESERVIHPAFRVADASEEEDREESNEAEEEKADVMLLLCTILVSVLSEFLVGNIDGMPPKCKMSPASVGIILLSIIGNAVQHIRDPDGGSGPHGCRHFERDWLSNAGGDAGGIGGRGVKNNSIERNQRVI